MANVFEPDFDAEQDRDGFSWRRARVGLQAGAQRLGASVFELGPRQAAFPYHAHLANEEMLIVLDGTPVLRTPSGERTLEQGELVAFPAGPDGAHQVINRGTEPVRLLMLSQMVAPEVVIYPDTEKLAAREQPPGSPNAGKFLNFFERDAVDYFEGEEPPATG